jgi:U6 snRNA-associated Sm-like protein LSm6
MSSQSPEPEAKGPAAGSPADFLKNIVGKKVKVRIGSGVDYHGESNVTSRACCSVDFRRDECCGLRDMVRLPRPEKNTERGADTRMCK